FIAADMEIAVGKKPCHLADKLVEELVNVIIRRVHRRIEHAPLPLDLVRPRPARQFGVTHEPCRAVPRNIELRYYPNASLLRVCDHLAHLLLGVVPAIGPPLLQLGKFLALYPESLVVRQVPVKNVQLDCRQAIEIALDHFHRHEMPRHIDHQPPPWKTRLVLDRDRWYGETALHG